MPFSTQGIQAFPPNVRPVLNSKIICHVIDYGGPTSGSFIPALISLGNAIVRRGDRFVVIATQVPNATWPSELKAAGAQLHLVNRNDQEVIACLRTLKPDIVHSHFTRYDIATLHGWPKARIFWHVHSYREDHRPLIRARGFLKHCVLGRRVEALVAVSEQMGREITAWWYGPSKRVHVIQNGIDTEYFRPPTREERAATRQKHGIGERDRVILFFERVALKGGAALRAALPSLPGYRLLVVGGTKVDRDRFGPPPQVISLDRVADTRQLYWATDVLAFGSNHEEAFGLVIVEALACGVPIAATDLPVVHEICDDIESIAYFPVGDAGAWARSIETVFGRNSTMGRERAVAKFSLPRWTAGILRLYDESS